MDGDSRFIGGLLYSIEEYPVDQINATRKSNSTKISATLFELFSLGYLKTCLKKGYVFYENNLSLLDTAISDCEREETAFDPFLKDQRDGLYISVLSKCFTNKMGYIPSKRIRDYIHRKPDVCITKLDKAMFGMICNIMTNIESDSYIMFREPDDSLPLLISFFDNIQKLEFERKITIDYETSDDMYLTNLLFLGYRDYDEINTIKISEDDIQLIKEAIEFKGQLNKLIDDELKEESDYAHTPENESYWNEYIKLINYRSSEEQRVLSLIKQRIPVEDKEREFSNYVLSVLGIEEKLNGFGHSPYEIVNKIHERVKMSINFMWVKTGTGSLINLADSLKIVACPCTFNAVLIAYHLYLLSPSQSNALAFLLVQYFFVLESLYPDRVPEKVTESCDSLIEKIFSLIDNYFNEHRSTIDTLAVRNYEQYKKIQNETSVALFCFSNFVELRSYENLLDRKNRIQNDLERICVDSGFLDRVEGRFKSSGKLEITEDDEELLRKSIETLFTEDYFSQLDLDQMLEDEKSRQLIVSVHSIYLFVEFLGKVLQSEEKYIDDLVRVKSIKGKLTKIERYLINSTYITPYLDCFDNEDIQEYRESRGIDASDIEVSNAELRDVSMLKLTKNTLEDLHSRINEYSTYDDIIDVKNELRNAMRYFPNEEIKTIIESLVDAESEYISKKLIDQTIDVPDFEKYRKEVMEKFGSKASILPKQAIESLSTAELLFNKYANKGYADEGFDYSCISALYYQSVETMYNQLIWCPYAKTLNSMSYSNGISYPELFRNKSLPDEYKGYLPTGFFVKLKGSIFPNHLTMGSFVYLLDNAAIHFNKYFDAVFGKGNIDKTSDIYTSYKERVHALSAMLQKATDPRNNASHGSTVITMEDCQYDRKMVLDKIDLMRKDTFGIIDMFLSLY